MLPSQFLNLPFREKIVLIAFIDECMKRRKEIIGKK